MEIRWQHCQRKFVFIYISMRWTHIFHDINYSIWGDPIRNFNGAGHRRKDRLFVGWRYSIRILCVWMDHISFFPTLCEKVRRAIVGEWKIERKENKRYDWIDGFSFFGSASLFYRGAAFFGFVTSQRNGQFTHSPLYMLHYSLSHIRAVYTLYTVPFEQVR